MTTSSPTSELAALHPLSVAAPLARSLARELTCTEELLVLSHDETNGKRLPPSSLRHPLAAALLMDLVKHGRISCSAGRLAIVDPCPTGIPFLDRALVRMAEERGEHSVRFWIDRLGGDAPAVEAEALEGLVEAGILRRAEHWLFGRFGRRRYPTTDPMIERTLKRRLVVALLGDAIPPGRDISLLALAEAAGLLRCVLSTREAARRAPRAAHLRPFDPIGHALYEMLLDMKIETTKAISGPFGLAA